MLETNDNPQSLPVKKIRFGGRYNDSKLAPVAPPPPDPVAKKENKYPFRGTCKITGFHDQHVDSEGISSKGRSRMKSRIRYQQTKVNAAFAERFRADLKKLEENGFLDTGTQKLLFSGEERISTDLADYARDIAHASVYHPPTPRVKKA